MAMRKGTAGTSADPLTWLGGDQQENESVSVVNGGITANVQKYYPFGGQRGGNTLAATDRGFLGQIEDASTGLSFLNARYYDTNLARFLSPDPLMSLARPQGLNPYTYGLNNPATYSDPTGLWPHLKLPKILHTVLTVASFIPGPIGTAATVANAVAYAAEGNWKQAAIEAGGALLAAAGGKALAKGAEKLAERAALKEAENLVVKEAASAVENEAEHVVAREAGEAAEALPCNSFDGATHVVMADGSRKRIDKVRVGDHVLALDPKSGVSGARAVQRLIVGHGAKNLVAVKVATADGEQTILATDKPPSGCKAATAG